MSDTEEATSRQDDTLDPLTGLETRSAFDDALLRETAFARRHSIQLALFLVDVDGLRAVNQAHGEATGDKVLAHLGRALRKLVSNEVVLARVGGEVFGLLLRGLDAPAAEKEAERLRACVGAVSVTGPNGPVQVTASVGAATFHSARAATPDVLVHAAELALLEAKKQGRNQVRVQVDGLPAPTPTPPV